MPLKYLERFFEIISKNKSAIIRLLMHTSLWIERQIGERISRERICGACNYSRLMNGGGPDRCTASSTNSILRVPAGLTPACKTRGFAIHPPQRQTSLSNPNFLRSFACQFVGRHPFANAQTASDSHETVRRGQKQTLWRPCNYRPTSWRIPMQRGDVI